MKGIVIAMKFIRCCTFNALGTESTCANCCLSSQLC